MFEQSFETCNLPPDSLLARYVEGERKMERLHQGVLLRAAARSVLAQLPDGPLALVGTSTVGAGLAAACAALREQPTTWRHIDLLTEPDEAIHPVAVVDPVDAGEGWRAAVLMRFPSAVFVTPAAMDATVGLAA